MTSAAMVKNAGAVIVRAVEARDWVAADRGLENMTGLWLRAGVRGDDATAIAAVVDELRIALMTEHDVDQEIGPVELAWMLAGVSNFLSQAVNPPELTGADTPSRILEALASSSEALTTNDLASRIQRTVNTVARELPRLRDEGLVRTSAAGRTKLNEITAAGRERQGTLGQLEPIVWPTSLARHTAVEGATMDASDFVDSVQPNDVSSIRALR